MSDLLRGDDPAEALRIYIRAKLQSSRERPHGSRVFTREVMAGAPRFGQAIASQVGPALAADVQAFERWVAQGKIARVDFTDRKSTRLNSSHSQISYAVFCLKKKKKTARIEHHELAALR